MATEKEIRTGGYSRPFFVWGGGELWRRGPNLPPFSIYSTVLGHFILKLLYTDIILFYFYFLYLFSRWGGGGGANRPLYGFGEDHGPKCPLEIHR